MTKLIETALTFFERELECNRVPLLILEAPTGYGKTKTAPYFFKVAMEKGTASRLIHVLPMRTLVKKIRESAIELGLYSFLNLKDDEIGYQASLDLGETKTPTYLKRVTYSTFDSFIYNLFKLSVAESWKSYIHYEVPRGMIFLSVVGLDEAHLYGGDPIPEPKKEFDSFIAAVTSLATALVPTYILSATLPTTIINSLVNRINEIPALQGKVSPKTMIFDVYDREIERLTKDYISEIQDIHWVTNITDKEEKFMEKIEETVKESDRDNKVLIIRNTPEKAVATYNVLIKKTNFVPGSEITVIHGRQCGKDRDRASKEIDNAKVIISTQVIEAGITIEGVKYLFTDAAPPTSLAQRAGRLLRWKDGKSDRGEKEAKVFILSGDGDNVYNKEIVVKTCQLIAEKKDIDWRLPTSLSRKVPPSKEERWSFKTIIEEIYNDNAYQVNYTDYSSLLTEIDLNTMITANEVRDIEEKLCGLVRDSLMCPVYIGQLDSVVPEEIDKDMLICNYNWLLSNERWKNIFVIKDERFCKAVLQIRDEDRYEFTYGFVKTEIFNGCRNMMKALRNPKNLLLDENGQSFPENVKASLVAFVCKDGLYKEREGLVV